MIVDLAPYRERAELKEEMRRLAEALWLAKADDENKNIRRRMAEIAGELEQNEPA